MVFVFWYRGFKGRWAEYAFFGIGVSYFCSWFFKDFKALAETSVALVAHVTQRQVVAVGAGHAKLRVIVVKLVFPVLLARRHTLFVTLDVGRNVAAQEVAVLLSPWIGDHDRSLRLGLGAELCLKAVDLNVVWFEARVPLLPPHDFGETAVLVGPHAIEAARVQVKDLVLARKVRPLAVVDVEKQLRRRRLAVTPSLVEDHDLVKHDLLRVVDAEEARDCVDNLAIVFAVPQRLWLGLLRCRLGLLVVAEWGTLVNPHLARHSVPEHIEATAAPRRDTTEALHFVL